MIKNIKLENFQSHKNTTIEFSKGVNVIEGSSSCGKTTLVRALRWLLFNAPLKDYTSDWGGDCSVTVELNNTIVKRIRSKKENKYYLSSHKDGFLAGKTVPEEINKILNVDTINLQRQFQPHFLLNEEISAGKVSEYLNKIINLESIDKGLVSLNKSVKDNKQKTKYEKENLTNLKEQQEEYSWLEEAEKELNLLVTLEYELFNLCTKCVDLEKLINELKEVDSYLDNKDYTKYEKETNKLILLKEELDKINNEKYSLNELVNELKNINEVIEEDEEILSFKDEVEKLVKLYEKYNELIENINSLDCLITEIKAVSNVIHVANEHKIELEALYEETFPDQCPLCGR